MIRNPKELLAAISARVGDDVSEEALQLLEDATDTLTDYETRAASAPTDGIDWQGKYNDLAERYKTRFLTGAEVMEDQKEDMEKDSAAESMTFEKLFEKREG